MIFHQYLTLLGRECLGEKRVGFSVENIQWAHKIRQNFTFSIKPPNHLTESYGIPSRFSIFLGSKIRDKSPIFNMF